MPAETTVTSWTSWDAVPSADSPAVPAEAVAPLIRGVGVLRRLTEADGTMSASGLERATGLARSTVDRIASTLARMGYVRLDGRDVILTPRLMELGNAYLAALRLLYTARRPRGRPRRRAGRVGVPGRRRPRRHPLHPPGHPPPRHVPQLPHRRPAALPNAPHPARCSRRNGRRPTGRAGARAGRRTRRTGAFRPYRRVNGRVRTRSSYGRWRWRARTAGRWTTS